MARFLAWILLLVPAPGISTAWGGTVEIYVSSDYNAGCLPVLEPEHTQYLLSPEEMNAALDRYFKGVPNRELYDAAISGAGIRFCTDKERGIVFKHLLKQFDQPEVDGKILDVAANQFQAKAEKRLFEAALKSEKSSAQLKANLKRLRKYARRSSARKTVIKPDSNEGRAGRVIVD